MEDIKVNLYPCNIAAKLAFANLAMMEAAAKPVLNITSLRDIRNMSDWLVVPVVGWGKLNL